MRKSLSMSVIAIVLLGLVAVSGFAGKAITIKGSDTMVVLAQKWAEKYRSI